MTNLLETLNIITDAVNKGKSVDLVLLDFAKAFDKVSHEKLLLKLEAYRIDSITGQRFSVEQKTKSGHWR